VDQVATGVAALGIAPDDGVPDTLERAPLISDRFYALLPPGHPLAARDRLTWSQLARGAFVALGPESSVRRYTDAGFAEAGTPVAHLLEARGAGTVAGLVAAGLGVSALPGLVWRLIPAEGLVRRPLTGPVVRRRLVVLWAADRPLAPAARALRDHLVRLEGRVRLPDGVAWDRAR
jgi:DNA-binding transcriptional LysR family regulator